MDTNLFRYHMELILIFIIIEKSFFDMHFLKSKTKLFLCSVNIFKMRNFNL